MNDVLSLAELKKYRDEMFSAISYLSAIADTVPHNAEAKRHLGKIKAIQVKLASMATLMEHGG